jgi:hypothetical protein
VISYNDFLVHFFLLKRFFVYFLCARAMLLIYFLLFIQKKNITDKSLRKLASFILYIFFHMSIQPEYSSNQSMQNFVCNARSGSNLDSYPY